MSDISRAKRAAILVVHGRRRTGKTTLVEHCYGERNLIKLEGIEGKDTGYQIESFLEQLSIFYSDPLIRQMRYSSWREPLRELARRVEGRTATIFLEELQWLASYKEDLIVELKFIWDNYLSKNPNLILVLCGSSPSFMVSKVINSKALHNRSHYQIPLQPFTIPETIQFMQQRKGTLSSKGDTVVTPNQALEGILLVGGIPEYLNYITLDSSPYLAFCAHAFKNGGFFTAELSRIIVSSLAKEPKYLEILERIAKGGVSSRANLLKLLKVSSGGNITRIFNDLEASKLIYSIRSFASRPNSKLIRYEIADPYVRMYYKYIAPKLPLIDSGVFNKTPTKGLLLSEYYQSLGYAFEHYCRANPQLIAEAIGFSDVQYKVGSWLDRGEKSSSSKNSKGGGLQIDLVFQRADRVLTLCELKYTKNKVDLSEAKEFSSRVSALKIDPKYTVQTALIAPNGATDRVLTAGIFDRVIGLNELIGSS